MSVSLLQVLALANQKLLSLPSVSLENLIFILMNSTIVTLPLSSFTASVSLNHVPLSLYYMAYPVCVCSS